MKQFFEQYGSIALGILALLVLVAMITPVGNIIKTSLQGTVDTFSTKMNTQVDTMAESASEAFINASDFTGVKDHTYYFNGQIHPVFKENGFLLNEDGSTAIDKNGVTYNHIYADVNIILNDETMYCTGISNLIYDVYINNVLKKENVGDSYIPISLNNNDEVKIVIKRVPDGYRVTQNEYIYKTYEQDTIMIDSDTHGIYIHFLIYAYNN